jgi:hypothetical protein
VPVSSSDKARRYLYSPVYKGGKTEVVIRLNFKPPVADVPFKGIEFIIRYRMHGPN